MTLRGKDYCNCEHAKMLRKAIEEAYISFPYVLDMSKAERILKRALDEDGAACKDLWGDMKEARS